MDIISNGVTGESTKCVMVIDSGLPLGLKVNTAGLLGATLGKRLDKIIGTDVVDASGEIHVGILNVPLPILSADADTIKAIKEKAMKTGGLLVVDFTETAQREVRYEDYTVKLAATPACELRYLGVALYGVQKSVNKLVGNLPLLR
jgi:hypothetical protein